MTERERLIDILQSKPYGHSSYDEFADYLLENGVIVPPCKIGDFIYVIPSKVNYAINAIFGHKENNRVHKQAVEQIRIFNDGYLLMTCNGLQSVLSEGYKENWFLTREEAENQLKIYESKVGDLND